ncbi:MAG: hypothetical protein OXB86_04965 [Bdellovibrionales bacterium]|nr:hypothetical protein [Bdellovibrionales bacterium]
MKKNRFLPSLFLLGLIHLFLLVPTALFLDWQYLIPALALLGAMDLFLFFVYEKQLFSSLPLTPLPPEDPWNLHSLLKKSSPSLPVTLYLIKVPYPISLCFGNFGFCRIVFSEKLLEMLSPEEKEIILSYYVQAGTRGWVFFFTLISALLKGANGFFVILNLPNRLFQKKQTMNIVFRLFLQGLSPFLRKIHLHLDQKIQGPSPKKLARTLWKMQSLYDTESSPLSAPLAPLCFANPLTNSKTGDSIPLQPNKRQRTKALIGAYPP